MRAYLSIAFILSLAYTSLHAQVTITGVSKVVLCPANTFNVNYTAPPGAFSPGNIFSVQLSDANGNFVGANPIIGSKSEYQTGNISCTIPLSVVPGVLYRVRIHSTQPATVSGSNAADLNIQSYLPPQLTNDTSVCAGGPCNLKVLNHFPSPANYNWYNPNGEHMANGPQITVTSNPKLISGKYTLTATYYGCTHTDTTTYVTVKPRPATPAVDAEDTICSRDTIHLTAISATAGVIYEWAGPNAFKSFSKDTSILNAPMAAQGYYKATAISVPDGCRSFPDSQFVVVKLSPPIDATNTGPVCEGLGLYITASDSTDSTRYSWIGPGGFNMTSNDTGFYHTTLSMSGDYILTATLFDCISIDTTTVLVKPWPEDPDAGSNSPVCSGDELKLTAAGSAANVYTWAGPETYNAAVQNPVREGSTPNMSGRYIVSSNLDGCIKKDTIDVLVKPTPEIPQIGNIGKVTEHDTLRIEIKNPQAGVSYRWDGPGGFMDTTINLTIPNIQLNQNGIYSVTASYDGCHSISAVNVLIWGTEDTGRVNLYPNPNNGNFTLEGFFHLNEDMGISIHNSVGQILYRRTVPTVNNLLQDKISIPGAANGVYYLRMRKGRTNTVLPFVIKH